MKIYISLLTAWIRCIGLSNLALVIAFLPLTGRHTKIQGHWRRFKNRHDPTGKMPEIGLDYIENRRTQVCEVWQTGSVWATWLETKRGTR